MNKKNIIITCLFGIVISGFGGCPLPKGCEKASVYNPPKMVIDAGTLDSGITDDCLAMRKCADCISCCEQQNQSSCDYFCHMQQCEQ